MDHPETLELVSQHYNDTCNLQASPKNFRTPNTQKYHFPSNSTINNENPAENFYLSIRSQLAHLSVTGTLGNH